MIPKELNISVIEQVYNQIQPYIIRTPLLNNFSLNNDFETNLFLKLEFLQNSGCFKARGAINNLINLNDIQKKNGVTAVSAGNHAIAVSYAANIFSVKNKIFMYESANQYRLNKVKSLKANLLLTNPINAFKDVQNASKKDGYYYVHPFDGKFTLQGTASLGYEIINQVDKIDNVIIAVGGGGLISGVGSIIRQKFPNCNIIGVEPEESNGMTESLKKGYALKKVKTNSIADSLSPPLHMPYSFSVCKEIINYIVLVSDNEMKKYMKYMFENFKFFLEPACVAGIAALLGPLKGKLKNQNTLVIMCGSNIDVNKWFELTNNL